MALPKLRPSTRQNAARPGKKVRHGKTARPIHPGKTAKILGLDFGAHTLKLSEVEHGPLGPVVKTFGIMPYLRNRNEQADLVATLEELLHAAQTQSRDVLLAVPETDAFILTREREAADFTDPARDLPTWQRSVHQKMDEHFSSQNQIWPMTPTIEHHTGTARASFLAVPQLVVDFFSEILDTAGLNLIGVQHVPTALGRSFAETSRTGVLEFGAESSGWYVFDHGHLTQRANLPYGSEALTKALALAHGWSRDEAENHKRTLIGDTSTWPQPSAQVVDAFLKQWWADLFQNLAERPAHLEKLILNGGGSRFIPVREFAFNQLGLLPEDWQMPPQAHVAEALRPHLEPNLPVLVNSLALLVYS